MKLKLSEAVSAYVILGQFANIKMGVKTSYAISKNLRKLDPEYQHFETERKKLLSEYFHEVDGVPVVIPSTKDEADKEFEDLMNLEVDVDPYKFHLTDFGMTEVTPAQLLAIMWLIEE